MWSALQLIPMKISGLFTVIKKLTLVLKVAEFLLSKHLLM